MASAMNARVKKLAGNKYRLNQLLDELEELCITSAGVVEIKEQISMTERLYLEIEALQMEFEQTLEDEEMQRAMEDNNLFVSQIVGNHTLVEQVQALQAQLALRKPTVLASAVGGLPESKHLDGTNYSEWKFTMKNYLVNDGLWHCPCASSDVRKAVTAKQAWEKLRCAYEDNGLVRGLLIEFQPLILGIQGSNQKVTVEFIKGLLSQNNVQQLVSPLPKDESCAFVSESAKEKAKKRCNRKCFKCKQTGHILAKCPFVINDRWPSKNQKKSDKHLAASTNFAASCLLIQKATDGDKDWFLDSGAITHLTHRDDWMEEYSGRTTHTVAIANGTNITTKGCGVVKIPLSTEKMMVAHDVRHAPELALNLLSVSRIAAQKKTLIFDENGCRIVDLAVEVLRQHIFGTATQYNGLYQLNRCDHWAMAVQDVPDLWHRRLGHLSRGSMKLLQDEQATGIPSDAIKKTDCVTCLKGKQSRLPFPKLATKRTQEVLELVNSDICGPMQVASVGGARYFLSFIDDFSRKSFMYFLKHKNEALPKFKDFIAMVERQTSKRVKCLRTDNGREYVNNMFAEFLVRKGIRHERSIPETPQQNGVAERMNRTLVEKARTMLIDANLSPDLWAEAVGTANYLRNRCPTKALRKVTPEETWSGRKPKLTDLKVIGCLAMVHVPSGQRKKWYLKSEERIFIGYCETSKGYRTVDRKTKKMYVTRDVKFLESQFPRTQASKEESTNLLLNPDVGEEAVIVWTSQDSGSTEMDPNPSDPSKVDTDSDESIAQVCEQSDPISYEETENRPDANEWLKVINEELASHRENQS
ncbi:Retrovirus-related Pol polyprotein from transposon TNT 1-94 [Trichinella zimbabwensis]|uniref:Retrovirus-related Pol polyprotein from transposon TNT 1-94 n=1 Tax=Trichinella zimbabwensis TaxID=268475 RepID=A0A0V1HT08_9BILA|nr:Retrovirus-related Pol polyprotein from transposon TNT 1-94 [Trichinella zimbabwensis]